MKQTHKLVPIEPTALQVRAGQLGVTTTCAKAIYAAMLASAPEVGEAVEMGENTAKRFRGILSMLGISAPESDESLMLCQFSLLGMMRHKIQHIYYKPDRTAQLDEEKARLVEVKSELAKVREQLYKVSGSALLAGEKCKKEDAGILYNIVCTANNTLSYIETLIAEMEAKG